MKRLLVLVVLVGAVLFVLPSTASAQIPAESWPNDHCAYRSGDNNNGPFWAPDPINSITIGVAPGGAGSVAAAMQGTGAQECLLVPDPKMCPPHCSMNVNTVCEFHCFHNHTAPFPWWVRLTAQPQPGYFFLGWSANCSWGKTADRTWCVVHMQTDHNVTANFGTAPDTQAPTAPGVTAQSVGPFSVNLSWTPASDAWLAGYDVYQGATHVDRVGQGTRSYKVENLRCQTTYSFRVDAFDSTGNPASSPAVSARTGACPGAGPGGTVPNTVIHLKPRRVTRSRTAFFHFGVRAGSVPATKYQCKLDRGRWVRCSGRLGKRYRNLKRGYHTFLVKAGNGNGFDRTPSRWRWRIR